MLSSAIDPIADWSSYDTWIVLIAALSAMACALPGNYLVIRRQSMMGDALSHTALPGVVLAFLLSYRLTEAGWLTADSQRATLHAFMLAGALLIGVFSAVLTQWVQRIGRVEASAALGVVYVTLFAVGLLTLRLYADEVHIDPDCVLYGTLEVVVIDRGEMFRAILRNGLALLVNLALVILFFKELRISAFDPALATSQGISAKTMHYALMAVTAATLVMAFESVGSILVIAMLIAPATTAYLLTDRLGTMIALSLLIAALSALLGHVMAIALSPLIVAACGFPRVEASASTAGMMAAASGLLFVSALLFGPRYGLVSKLMLRVRLSLRIASEDILGLLYRRYETTPSPTAAVGTRQILDEVLAVGRWATGLALCQLVWTGRIARVGRGYRLTEKGQQTAQQLVRSHRLWESYMALHFELPDDHLHETASRVEHFIDSQTVERLAGELQRPDVDPHGKEIPPAESRDA